MNMQEIRSLAKHHGVKPARLSKVELAVQDCITPSACHQEKGRDLSPWEYSQLRAANLI